ncbi:MAG: hypothetical protein HOW73_18490 [Polyangiaceae bacterium]|nr:hypothetical protein [Polyangiaceae bacterium]
MAVGYVVVLHAIECKKLHEGGDEIYCLVNGVEHRPAADPDYWSFDAPGQRRYPNRLVLDGPDGAEVTITLREQDGGLRFEHDTLGEVVIRVGGGNVTFVEKKGTTYVGRRRGYHVVDFHDSDGVYALHFSARSVQDI